jgi:hypothetical protein
MNITLSADERIIKKARAAAQARGKSLNQLIREYLAELAGELSRDEAVEKFLAAFGNVTGRSDPGWKFDRNEIHERGPGR